MIEGISIGHTISYAFYINSQFHNFNLAKVNMDSIHIHVFIAFLIETACVTALPQE